MKDDQDNAKRERPWGWLKLLPPEERKAHEERAREREKLFESAERHLASAKRIGKEMERELGL